LTTKKKRPKNFVDLFVYSQGICETPRQWLTWAAISGVAACVRDSVTLAYFKDSPLRPNLYVLLVGGSGVGKGRAIGPVLELLEPYEQIVHPMLGRYTIQYVVDVMAQKRPYHGADGEMAGEILDRPKLWLVMTEMAHNIGQGGRADDFIKALTAIYDCPRVYDDGTRIFGGARVRFPCMNWLAGSTYEWYEATVKRENIVSGFQPRINVVWAEKDYAVRIEEPVYPEDYEDAIGELRGKVQQLVQVQGEFDRDETFRDAWGNWYMNRVAPRDTLEEGAYNAEKTKMLKLSMIAALAENPGLLVLSDRHLFKAAQWLKGLKRYDNKIQSLSLRTPEIRAHEDIVSVVERFGIVDHTELVKQLYKKGILANKFRTAREALYEAGLFRYFKRANGDGHGAEELHPLAVHTAVRVPGLVYVTRSAVTDKAGLRTKHPDNAELLKVAEESPHWG